MLRGRCVVFRGVPPPFSVLCGTDGKAAGCVGLLVKSVFYNGSIQAITAGEVIALISMLAKDTAGQIAAQAALTHDINGLMCIQLGKPVSQAVQRNIDKALSMPCGILPHGSRIQQHNAGTAAQIGQILVMELLHLACFDVFCNKTGHVYRVLG